MLFYILFYFVSFLLNCLKCLIQILDDIVDVLGTDGKTDGVWFDSLIQQFFLGALAAWWLPDGLPEILHRQR